VKIRFSSITFSTYKYTMFSALIKYLINIFNFRKKKEFVYYWIRYYKYCFKKLLANVEVELIKYIRVILKQYNLFNSLISLKEKKKNIFYFFYFFFKRYKYKFLRKCKMFKYFLNVKKLFKSNFFKKNSFSLFFFNKNRLTFSLFSCSYKNKIKKIKFLIKIKALIFIKNFIFLILFL
jgi:hypothetical protein